MKSVLAALLLLGSVQDQDSLEYQHWANCKPGSWVKNRMVMENQGKKIEYESVTRLLEVSDERVRLEILTRMKTGERSVDQPPQKHEIKAKGPPKGKTIAERDEEVSVSGKTFKCRFYEMETEATAKAPKVNLKAWMTKDIPGGVARSEVLSEGMTVPIRTVALEWQKD